MANFLRYTDRMQRFFLAQNNFSGKSVVISDPKKYHQITHVLRMNVGGEFIALDGSGTEYVCKINDIKKYEIHANIIFSQHNKAEPLIKVTLYQAIPKKAGLFELILQKCTELGVTEFVPLITERTQKCFLPKRERLITILTEAAEQCERGIVPILSEPIDFITALNSPLKGKRVLLHCRGILQKFKDYLGTLPQGVPRLDIFIGPEGGFSENEVEKAVEAGISICSLGPSILRIETAAIVACGISLL